MTCVVFRKLPCVKLGINWTGVQNGLAPDDAKAMPSIGVGVVELRLWDEAGTFRVVYVAKLADAVYVLHCFQKKTQQTAKRDIELAQKRLKALMKEIAP